MNKWMLQSLSSEFQGTAGLRVPTPWNERGTQQRGKWDAKNRFVVTLTLWLQPAKMPQAQTKRGKGTGALLGSGGQRKERAPQTPEQEESG